MIRAGLSFEDALKEAQQKGLCRGQPRRRCGGARPRRARPASSPRSCWGKHVYPDAVAVEGITGISLDDVTFASSMDKVIKLLGRVVRQEGEGLRLCLPPPDR